MGGKDRIMEYTYSSYQNLMESLKQNGYKPIRFCDVSENIEFQAIIRHDVDIDLQEAVKLARLEYENSIKSTYFVLLTSEYYNLLARHNIESAKEILSFGHEIGLHFDITCYNEKLPFEKIVWGGVKKETDILSRALDIKVKSVSWHIPRKNLLGAHLDCMDELGLFNAYDPYFYSGYKYVSDSMMRWREPVEEYIQNKKYKKLQILTHPIWYRDLQNKTDEEILDLNKEKRIEMIDHYLDTIKPGAYLNV